MTSPDSDLTLTRTERSSSTGSWIAQAMLSRRKRRNSRLSRRSKNKDGDSDQADSANPTDTEGEDSDAATDDDSSAGGLAHDDVMIDHSSKDMSDKQRKNTIPEEPELESNAQDDSNDTSNHQGQPNVDNRSQAQNPTELNNQTKSTFNEPIVQSPSEIENVQQNEAKDIKGSTTSSVDEASNNDDSSEGSGDILDRLVAHLDFRDSEKKKDKEKDKSSSNDDSKKSDKKGDKSDKKQDSKDSQASSEQAVESEEEVDEVEEEESEGHTGMRHIKRFVKSFSNSSALRSSSRSGSKRKSRFESRRLRREAKQEAALAASSSSSNSNLDAEAEEERRAIAAVCEKYKLVLHEVDPDGSCMYASIADQINVRMKPEEPVTVQTMRKIAADFMRAHKDDFIFFIAPEDDSEAISNDDGVLTDEQYEQYCDRIENTHEWGGEPEMLAISRHLNVPIYVIQSSTDILHLGEQEDKDQPDPLYIAYHRKMYGLGEHYNSLRPRPSDEEISQTNQENGDAVPATQKSAETPNTTEASQDNTGASTPDTKKSNESTETQSQSQPETQPQSATDSADTTETQSQPQVQPASQTESTIASNTSSDVQKQPSQEPIPDKVNV